MEDRKAPMERPPPPPPPVHTGDGGNEGSELPWPTRLCEALLAPEKASKQSTRSDRTRSAVSALSAPRDAYSTDFLMLIEAEATRVLAIQGSVPFEIIQKATECCHASLSYRSGQHELAASLAPSCSTASPPALPDFSGWQCTFCCTKRCNSMLLTAANISASIATSGYLPRRSDARYRVLDLRRGSSCAPSVSASMQSPGGLTLAGLKALRSS